jgi:amidohydrolase
MACIGEIKNVTPHPPSGKGAKSEEHHQKIDTLAGKVQAKVARTYKDIHKNAELSNREFRTSKKVADHLKSLKLDSVKTKIAPTGVVGILKGGKPGKKVIALRADMDALPVKETVDVPYKSTQVDEDYPGGPFPVAHSCGHDAHTAMLMGAAEVLSKVRDEIPGTVMFVFQPAEEGPPIGEEFGAEAMLKAGVFKKPKPDCCFAIHTSPLPADHVGYARGPQMASSVIFKVHITGKQVHGSMPWAGLDPMPVLASINDGFAQIYRQIGANEPITISVGKIDTVGRTNIIGDHIDAWGTVRCVHDRIMGDVNKRMRRVVEDSAKAHGLAAKIEFFQKVPSAINTPKWVDTFAPSLERVVGKAKLHVIEPVLGYDDASQFIRAVGGLYAVLGSQNTKLTKSGLKPMKPGKPMGGPVVNHTPGFYVVPEALETGVRLHCHAAIDFLSQS